MSTNRPRKRIGARCFRGFRLDLATNASLPPPQKRKRRFCRPNTQAPREQGMGVLHTFPSKVRVGFQITSLCTLITSLLQEWINTLSGHHHHHHDHHPPLKTGQRLHFARTGRIGEARLYTSIIHFRVTRRTAQREGGYLLIASLLLF
jgi:hypothetical protein